VKKSPLLPIFLIVVVDVLGLTIILPLLPLYAEKMGATPFLAGSLVSSYALCQLVAGPILGRLSDRYGRRPILLLSQLGTFVGFIILAFAHQLWVVFLSRVVDGLTAGNLSVAQAYISDVTEPKNRAKSFGLIGIAFGLGFLVGPGVSGLLARYGYQYPIFAAAALSATSILATYFFLPSVPPKPHGVAVEPDAPPLPSGQIFDWKATLKAFQNRPLAKRLWQFLAFAFAFALFMAGFALFAERRFVHEGRPFTATEIGFAMAYMGLVGVVVQGGLIGRLIAFFGEAKLVLIGFIGMLAGYLIMGEAQGMWALHISLTVMGFGHSVLRPCVTSLISQAASRAEQGFTMGLMQSLLSIAQIAGPMLGGFLIQHAQLRIWSLASAFFCAVGLVLSWSGEGSTSRQT